MDMQRLNGGNPANPANPLDGGTAAFQRPLWEPQQGGPPVRINALDSLRRHRGLAIGVALGTFCLAMLYIFFKYDKTYVAETILYVSPTYPATLSENGDREADRPYDSFIDQQVHAVTRHDILVNALHSLPSEDWSKFGKDEDAAAEHLASQLVVLRIDTTYQVKVDLTGNSPDHLSEIVNAVAKAFVATAKSEEFYGRDSRLAGLKEERDKLDASLKAEMAEQADLLKTLGLASLDNQPGVGNPYNERIIKMRADLQAARQERETAEAQLDSLSRNSGGGSALQAEAQLLIASDAGLNSLRTSMNARRAQLSSEIAGMTEQNPVRAQDEYELAEIDSQLMDMTTSLESKAYQQLQAKYRAQLNRARAVETSLMSDLSRQTTETTTATPKFQRAGDLNVDIAQNQARLNELNERVTALELESSSPGSVHIFSPSDSPSHPDSSKTNTLILVLIPVCLVFGLIAAIARDVFFNNTIFTSDDIERCIGVPPVGMVFDHNTVSPGILDACLMRVAASIDSALQRAGVRTFAITSVKSSGGTSTLAVGLAEELARMGRRVLVLNAEGGDLPRGWYPPDEDGKVREFTPNPVTLRMDRQPQRPSPTQRSNRGQRLLQQPRRLRHPSSRLCPAAALRHH